MDYLVPERTRYNAASNIFSKICTQKEKNYNIFYHVEDLPESFNAEINKGSNNYYTIGLILIYF